jgi:hypothetical protein
MTTLQSVSASLKMAVARAARTESCFTNAMSRTVTLVKNIVPIAHLPLSLRAETGVESTELVLK